MPTIQDNLDVWNTRYDWSQEGDEWSAAWGGTELLWWGTIFPRIHAFIPTVTILEIGPGFGRGTQYLKDFCQHLVVVDLSERCIEACKKRFSSHSHITYHVNDGKSLEMIPDQSIDFVFSFDSLVHAEADVIEAYIDQLAIKLKPNGVGFIHHSNIGEYLYLVTLTRKMFSCFRDSFIKGGLLINLYSWRAESMTADLFKKYCQKVGLVCISQEKVNWMYGKYLIDSFSLFTHKNSVFDRPYKVFNNKRFMDEAKLISKLSQLYTTSSF